jgi:dGTPase
MVTALIEGAQEGKIGFSPGVLEPFNELRDFLFREVYPCEAIVLEMDRASKVLRELYFHLLANPVEEILRADPEDSIERRTVDFVAGMTDEYAMSLYQRLLLPSPWKA